MAAKSKSTFKFICKEILWLQSPRKFFLRGLKLAAKRLGLL